ncbi:sulfatase-like hydrolase/transferase, partial [Pseudomonadota bacterium]
PTLFYLHALLPHFPFIFSGQGMRSDNKFNFLSEQLRKSTGTNNWPAEVVANLTWQAHLLQLGYIDFLLGKILDRLIELDMFAETLIIVIADHGMSFYWDSLNIEREKLANVQASETLLIPFLMKSPNQESSLISDSPAQIIDIVPTIAEAVGLTVPWQVGGLSVLQQISENRTRFARVPDRRAFGAVIDPDYLALRRKTSLFGSGDLQKLYRSGPHPEIVGKPVNSFAMRTGYGSIQIDHPEQYIDVDPASNKIPVYIEGEVSVFNPQDKDRRMQLAFAVNGMIQSTTVTTGLKISDLRKEESDAEWQSAEQRASSNFSDGKQVRQFLSRVPVESFKNGVNDIGVFVILDGNPGEPVALGTLDVLETENDGQKQL